MSLGQGAMTKAVALQYARLIRNAALLIGMKVALVLQLIIAAADYSADLGQLGRALNLALPRTVTILHAAKQCALLSQPAAAFNGTQSVLATLQSVACEGVGLLLQEAATSPT